MFNGMQAQREWLEAQGFSIAPDGSGNRLNRCNWYAYRRSELPARVCECNDDKPGAQIVIRPFEWDEWIVPNHAGALEVELCAQAAGVWWNFTAYSISADELPANLADVERRLIAAWNALV
jgi:hypothetical protein